MNKYQRPILTLISLLALLWQTSFSQGVENCFDLNELYSDSTLVVGKATNTQAGTSIFSRGNISFSLDSFTYQNGTKGYENIILSKDFFGGVNQNELFLFPSNINLNFKFSSDKEILNSLCFNFIDAGGEVNISINGSPILNLLDFFELNLLQNNPFGEDVSFSIIENTNSNFPAGRFCIEGNIKSLIIGGQEMGINNICYSTRDFDDNSDGCPIKGIKTHILSCDGDIYQLLVDLKTEGARAIDSFMINVEGQTYGPFGYADLPIQLDDVPVLTDALNFEVTACDTREFICCQSTTVDKSNCQQIEKDCIGFDDVNPGIYGSSTQYSKGDKAFTAGNIDFYVTEIPTLFWTTIFGDLAVVESDFPSAPFGEGQFLFYEGISTAMDFSQYSDPVERVTIDVRLLDGPVNVSANGVQPFLLLSLTPETYQIGPDVTLTVKVDEADPTVNTLIFEGNIQSLLLGAMSMYVDNLCINNKEECALSEISYSATDCNDKGEFYVNLDFEYSGTSDSFYVYQNGSNLGQFNYNWLPIKLGPFSNTDKEIPISWVIVDAENPNCIQTARIDTTVVCPQPCLLKGIKVIRTECTDDDYHILTFDLEGRLDPNGEFTLITEGDIARVFSYADLPVSVKVLNNTDPEDLSYKFQVCDNNSATCCLTTSYRLSCEPCNIGDLRFKPVDCNSDGSFYVLLDFEFEGGVSDSFYVFQGDKNLGLFNYKWLPISIGPFERPASGEILDFAVIDSENPNCANKGFIDNFDCPEPCPIYGIKIIDTQCNDEDSHVLTFDLDRPRNADGSFILFTEDGRSEEYKYSQLPVTIKMPNNEDKDDYSYKIKICDSQRDDCCVEKSYRLDCRPCEISNVRMKPDDCNLDGSFYVLLDFDFEGGVSDSFFIYQGDKKIGRYNYKWLPTSFGPIQRPNNADFIDFTIIDSKNRGCSIKARLDNFDCPEPCPVYGIKIIDTQCNDEDSHLLTFDLDRPSNADGSFILFTEDGRSEEYKYSQLPVTIKMPNNEDKDDYSYKIKICDSQRDDCCVEKTYRLDCRPCEISNVRMKAVDCGSDDSFHVLLDFDFEGGLSDSFYIYQGDKKIGRYNYKWLPDPFGPIQRPDNADFIDFTIVDSKNRSCSTTARLDNFDCSECVISNLKVEPTECDEQGNFYVYLNFRHEGSNEYFVLKQNGNEERKVAYEELPLKLGPFSVYTDEERYWEVYDSEDPNCGGKVRLGAVECERTCRIKEAKIYDVECIEDGQYWRLSIDLDHAYNAGSFIVRGENYKEEFNYSELPIRIKVPVGNEWDYGKLLICDSQNNDCCVEAEFKNPCLFGDCEITGLTARPTDCDANGKFSVILNFDHKGSGESFRLWQNGNEIGEYKYSQLPIELGPFYSPISNGLNWQVIDAQNFHCSASVELGPINCQEVCTIKEIKILDIQCIAFSPNDDFEYYSLTFDLEREGGSKYFTVWPENGEKATFSYEDLPVTLKLKRSDAATPYRLFVCDNRYDDCCAEINYELPCRPDECKIGDLITEVYPCNDDGTFLVDLNFRHRNVSEAFYVMTPEDTMKFEYKDLPVTLGPFTANVNATIPIWVKDAEQDCANEAFIIPPFCGPSCNFQELQTWTTECNDAGQYYLGVKFSAFIGTASPGFIAFVNGEVFGPFNYTQNELKLGPFDANSGSDVDLLLIDLLDPVNCNAFVELDPVNCNRDCNIDDLVAVPVDCTDKGTLVYKVDFWYDGPEDQLFEVSTSFDSLGVAKGGDFPMEFEIEIPKNGQNPIFYVCAVDLPDCCAKVEADLPDCDNLCDLVGLKAEATDCTPNGIFYIEVHPIFRTDVVSADRKYNVYSNKAFQGTYSKQDFPIKIGPFEGIDGNTRMDIFVEAVEDTTGASDCEQTITIRTPTCDSCKIDDLELLPLSCNPDGTFALSLDFEHEGEESDTFTLTDLGDGTIRTYTINELPIKFDAIPNSASGHFLFEVCVLGKKACCEKVEMAVPDCPPPPCPIIDINIALDSCDADGNIFLQVIPVLDSSTLSSDDLFAVYAYDRSFGVHAANKFPLAIGPIGPDAGDLSITLEARGGQDCYLRKLFEPPYCEQKCEITAFNAVPLYCNPDGSYTFQIDLKAEHAGNEFFDLYSNNGFIGFYPLADLPITVDVFIPSGDTAIVFEACINDNPNCCTRLELEVPNCDNDCPIVDIAIEVDACPDDEGAFNFKLDFELEEGVSVNDSFYVNGPDSLLGPFALEDLPISIGPIEADDDDSQIAGIPFVITGLTDTCSFEFRVAVPECEEIYVWPGDANTDRIANHRDLIYLGVAFGEQGPARGELRSTWEGIPSTPWAQQFEGGVNFKHADCNGDGVVDIQDKAVIIRNYGQVHGPVRDAVELPQTDFDPPIFVDLPQEGEMVSGSTFTIPIILGTVDKQVDDIYGFSFTIKFDPKFIDPEKVQVQYPTSWFGQEGVNMLTIDKVYEDGRIEIAMTRNDQNDVSGYGPVAYLRGIIADIAGIVDTRMETAKPLGMGINTDIIPLGTQTTEIEVRTIDDPYTILESFNMFPIPAGDEINFTNALGLPADNVRIFDARGRQVLQTYKNVHEINVSELPSGMYIIRLKIQGIVINERFLKR